MGVLTFLKDTFAPSAQVSAQRRLDTFGTENKAVAGAAIVGSAAAAIAAVPFVASGAALAVGKAVSSKVVSTVAQATLKQQVVGGAVALVGTGVVIGNPVGSAKAIISTPSSLVNVGKNIGTLSANPSLENAKNIFTENPVVSSILAGGAVVAAGLGVAGLANSVNTAINTSATKKNTQAVIKTISETGLVSSPTEESTSSKSLTPTLLNGASEGNSSPLFDEKKASEPSVVPPKTSESVNRNYSSNKINIMMSNRMGNKSSKVYIHKHSKRCKK